MANARNVRDGGHLKPCRGLAGRRPDRLCWQCTQTVMPALADATQKPGGAERAAAPAPEMTSHLESLRALISTHSPPCDRAAPRRQRRPSPRRARFTETLGSASAHRVFSLLLASTPVGLPARAWVVCASSPGARRAIRPAAPSLPPTFLQMRRSSAHCMHEALLVAPVGTATYVPCRAKPNG